LRLFAAAEGSFLIALTNQNNDADRSETERLGVSRFVVKASMIPSEVVNMTQEEIAKHSKKA
jgi:hypothetical protein